MQDGTAFRSEKGPILWYILLAFFIIMAVIFVPISLSFGFQHMLIILVVLAVITVAIGVAVPKCIRYTFGEKALEVKVFTTEIIRYDSIVRITEDDSPVASMGVSLTKDRVEIIYNNKHSIYYVSPKDRDGFLSELKKRTPHAKYSDERVGKKKK